MSRQRITILGSTGSIGTSTLGSQSQRTVVNSGGSILVTGQGDTTTGNTDVSLVNGNSRWALMAESAQVAIRNWLTTVDPVIIHTNASQAALTVDAANVAIGGSVGAVGITNSGAYTSASTAITWGATTTVDFSAPEMQTLAITGDTTFASSNLVPGRQKTILVTGDSSTRNLTWPGGWICTGSLKPATLAANKRMTVWLYSQASADASVWISVAVEP